MAYPKIQQWMKRTQITSGLCKAMRTLQQLQSGKGMVITGICEGLLIQSQQLAFGGYAT